MLTRVSFFLLNDPRPTIEMDWISKNKSTAKSLHLPVICLNGSSKARVLGLEGREFLQYTGWWFQICFIFTSIWGRFPFWFIFQRGWNHQPVLIDIFSLQNNSSCVESTALRNHVMTGAIDILPPTYMWKVWVIGNQAHDLIHSMASATPRVSFDRIPWTWSSEDHFEHHIIREEERKGPWTCFRHSCALHPSIIWRAKRRWLLKGLG